MGGVSNQVNKGMIPQGLQQVIENGDELVSSDNLRKIVISKEGQSISFYSRADVGDAWVSIYQWDDYGFQINPEGIDGERLNLSYIYGILLDNLGNNTSMNISSSGIGRSSGTSNFLANFQCTVSSNTYAETFCNYTVIANATFTDPIPVNGNGYVVFVRNGTATIGGTAYGVGSLVYRVYHSGAWTSKNFGLSISSDYSNDSVAAAGGIPIGDMYHTAGVVKIRLT